MPAQLSHRSEDSIQAIDLHQVKEWLNQAGDIALSRRDRIGVNLKYDGTPTTKVDRDIEAFLLDRVRECYPNHHIITEESGVYAGTGEFAWAVDPIDGTRAFASGLPIWGISIGVLRGEEPYIGAFFMPALGDMYWGSVEGAFCNGKRLLRHSSMDPGDPLVFMAVPSNAHHIYEIDFPRVRSLGSTAAHLAYVARGAAIGTVTRRVKIWDIAGMLPILRQTGVTLVYLSGRPFLVRDLLSGHPATEPLVAAHLSVIDRVRTSFQTRQGH